MKTQADDSRAVHRASVFAITAIAVLLLAVLAACQSASLPEAQDTGVENATSETAPGDSGAVAPAGLIQIDPLDPEQAAAPARLQIPDIGLDVPVTPMGWRVVTIDGQRTTLWDVPPDSAGWHVNSAGAGAKGNTALSGRQTDGEAVFAPLALGTIEPGQEVQLTDADGLVFVYRVREVSDPIAISGASEEEKADAERFLASGEDAQLTLITGWPDFTTTHRIFAAADFLGTLN